MQLTLHSGYFRTVFLTRLSEWQGAVITMMWGLSILLPTSTYSTGAGYAGFRSFVPELVFGWALLALGAGRLLILSLNGMWQPMYFFRAGTAFLTTAVWLSFTLGFAANGAPGSWIALFPCFVVFEAANGFRAMNDATEAEIYKRRTAVAQ